MLNRLKKTFRDADASNNSRQTQKRNDNVHVNTGAESAGFICPMCMVKLQSPEDLQKHFDSVHAAPDEHDGNNLTINNEIANSENHGRDEGSTLPDSSKSALQPDINGIMPSNEVEAENMKNDVEVSTLRSEIEDLKASLKEEKWYTTELKKEMNILQSNKEISSSDYGDLKQQLKIATDTNELLAKQKEQLEKKAIALSEAVADAKAAKDEMESQKAAVEERSQNQIVELENAAAWVRDLESQLLQRPGADDVMVLKKELVSVQTLMDQMTLESEEKSKEVEKEKQLLQDLLNEAKAKAQIVQEGFDAFKNENERLKLKHEETTAAKNESMKLFEQQKDELSQMYLKEESTRQEQITKIQDALEKEQSHSQSLNVELNLQQEEKITMKDEMSRLSAELESLRKLYEKEQALARGFDEKYQSSEVGKSEAECRYLDVKEKLDILSSQSKIEIIERDARMEGLSLQRDELQSKLDEVKSIMEQMKLKNESLQTRCDELTSSSKEGESKNNSIIHELKIELAQFKIKMEALVADNSQILEQKHNIETNFDVMKKDHEEDRKISQSKLLELQQELLVIKMQNNQLEKDQTESSRKFTEAQLKLESMQKGFEEMQEKNYTLNTNFSIKLQEVESLKEKLIFSSNKLEEEISRREASSEEAIKLREERTFLMAQMEAGEGEAVARVQIAEENKSLRKLKDDAEKKLRDESIAHETAVESLSTKISEANSRILSLQEQCELSQQSLANLKDDLGSEKEKRMQLEAEVKAKAELLLATQASSATQRADIESHLNTVKQTLDRKMKELEIRNEELISLRTTLEDLKSQTSQLRQDHHKEISMIRSDLERTEREKQEALEDVARKTEDMESMKESCLKDNERRKEEMDSIEARHAEKIATLVSAQQDIKNDFTKMNDEFSHETSLRKEAENNLNQARRKVEEVEKACNATQIQLNSTTLELQKNTEECALGKVALRAETDARAAESLNYKELEQELQAKIRKDQEQYSDEIKTLKQENKDMNEHLKEERASKAKAENSLALAEVQLTTQREILEENDSLLSNLRSEREDLQQRLASDRDDLLQKITILEENVASSKHETELKITEVNQQSSTLQNTQDELNNLKSDLQNVKTKLKETEAELEKRTKDFEDMQTVITQLETDNKNLVESKSKLEKEIVNLIQSIGDLENQLSSSSSDFGKVTDELAAVKEKLKLSEHENTAKKTEWQEKTQEFEYQIKLLQENITSLEKEVADERCCREEDAARQEDEMREKQEKWRRKETLWNDEEENYKEKVDSLETAQKLLITHKLELQKSVVSLQAAIDGEKDAALAVEERARSNAKVQDEKITELKTQLENKSKELETSAAERVVSESRLQLEIGALSDNLNSTRSEWVVTTQRVDSMARENDDLRGQLVVLNATVQSNADERRALLERCLNAEQQVGEQTERVNELRRKLEDARAAMHELGRENQALQVKHTTTISKQWLDDSATRQCKACSRNFTLTVRKHHCRHCGDIFCSECSSRTATVASSKSPVRVCEKCYDELLVAS